MKYIFKVDALKMVFVLLSLLCLLIALFKESWFFLAAYLSIAFTLTPFQVIHYQGHEYATNDEKKEAASEDTAE